LVWGLLLLCGDLVSIKLAMSFANGKLFGFGKKSFISEKRFDENPRQDFKADLPLKESYPGCG